MQNFIKSYEYFSLGVGKGVRGGFSKFHVQKNLPLVLMVTCSKFQEARDNTVDLNKNTHGRYFLYVF